MTARLSHKRYCELDAPRRSDLQGSLARHVPVPPLTDDEIEALARRALRRLSIDDSHARLPMMYELSRCPFGRDDLARLIVQNRIAFTRNCGGALSAEEGARYIDWFASAAVAGVWFDFGAFNDSEVKRFSDDAIDAAKAGFFRMPHAFNVWRCRLWPDYRDQAIETALMILDDGEEMRCFVGCVVGARIDQFKIGAIIGCKVDDQETIFSRGEQNGDASGNCCARSAA